MRHPSRLTLVRLFVERVTVVDCGVLDRLRGLVGVSWIVDASLEGEVDENGMILDFGPAKRLIKQRIDELVDHRLLLPAAAPGLHLAESGDGADLTFTDDTGGRIHHRGPRTGLYPVPAASVDPERVARLLEDDLRERMPANVADVRLTLREESIEGASYSYCHGLKRHAGNCQRIGHGHRSRIEILADGRRSPAHEHRWAERWRDVFLGSRADLANDPGDARYRFAYRAAEGEFELELDAERCELLDADTTVENIAAYVAAELKREQPGVEFVVRAYEGVGKGAEAKA